MNTELIQTVVSNVSPILAFVQVITTSCVIALAVFMFKDA